MGQDGDRMGMWHISIPERRTHPLFFRYPSIGIQNATAAAKPPPPAAQRSLVIAPQQPGPAPPGDCQCVRGHHIRPCPPHAHRIRVRKPRPHSTHTVRTILQAILHNLHPTQQKYNFVPFNSQKMQQNACECCQSAAFLQVFLHIAIVSTSGAHRAF